MNICLSSVKNHILFCKNLESESSAQHIDIFLLLGTSVKFTVKELTWQIHETILFYVHIFYISKLIILLGLKKQWREWLVK